MRINGYRCDACCKEHLLDPTIISMNVTQGIPSSWFTIWPGQAEHDKQPLSFCSAKCLRDWAEKQVIAASPVANDPEYIKKLQELGEVPYKRMLHGTWLPEIGRASCRERG